MSFIAALTMDDFTVNEGTGSCKKKYAQTHKDKKWSHYKCAKLIKRTRNPHRANRHLYTNKDM